MPILVSLGISGLVGQWSQNEWSCKDEVQGVPIITWPINHIRGREGSPWNTVSISHWKLAGAPEGPWEW
jgi:hypothetical protein